MATSGQTFSFDEPRSPRLSILLASALSRSIKHAHELCKLAAATTKIYTSRVVSSCRYGLFRLQSKRHGCNCTLSGLLDSQFLEKKLTDGAPWSCLSLFLLSLFLHFSMSAAAVELPCLVAVISPGRMFASLDRKSLCLATFHRHRISPRSTTLELSPVSSGKAPPDRSLTTAQPCSAASAANITGLSTRCKRARIPASRMLKKSNSARISRDNLTRVFGRALRERSLLTILYPTKEN